MGESPVSMLAARIRELDAGGTEAPWTQIFASFWTEDADRIGSVETADADAALIVLLRNVAGPAAEALEAAAGVGSEFSDSYLYETQQVALDRLSAALAGVVAAARDESPDT